ncbi:MULTISPECIES: hypothetical protein [unclassified Okeania]
MIDQKIDVEELLTNLYNSFDPFQPLPAGDPFMLTVKKSEEMEMF